MASTADELASHVGQRTYSAIAVQEDVPTALRAIRLFFTATRMRLEEFVAKKGKGPKSQFDWKEDLSCFLTDVGVLIVEGWVRNELS